MGNDGLNFVTTGHAQHNEPGMTYLYFRQLRFGYTIRELRHSHPNIDFPSKSDMYFKALVVNDLKNKRLTIPTFDIYYVPERKIIQF